MTRPDRYVLGLSAFYHDSAACLIKNGRIVAAAQEERFSRRKGDARYPEKAIEYCLGSQGITSADLSFVGFYEKPLLKFERILETFLEVSPRGLPAFLRAGPIWAKQKLLMGPELKRRLQFSGTLLFSEHHESHAASAFFPSPFEDAAILTMDGVGEWGTATIGVGRGQDFHLLSELRWPDSLGLLYSAFTSFLGFKVNSGEYKVMGLAPYGEPVYVDTILTELMDLKEDGSFRLNQRYFNYLAGLSMTSRRFAALFEGPPRAPEAEFSRRDLDLARSIQHVCEEVMIRMAYTAYRETGLRKLCLAGGVALNCVGNGRLLRESPFEDLWIQPAAGDAGGAVGVALLIWHRHMARDRSPEDRRDSMNSAFLGPEFSDDEIEQTLKSQGAVYERLPREALLRRTSQFLADQNIVGWFNGRMEFGPRALGSRSILADPRNPQMQDLVNRKIKFREGFRPFAPSVLEERMSDYFDLDRPSPYMLLASHLREKERIPLSPQDQALEGLAKLEAVRSGLPAVTHVDYSARVHTVNPDQDRDFYDLLRAFENLTGCGVLLNTSFNVRGEPIVCSPQDAYRCFMGTEMDILIAGPFLLEKEKQPECGAGSSDE